MYIRAQQIDADVEGVPDQEHHDKQDDTCHTAAGHASHFVEHGGDNAGGESQCQQTGIGQNVA